MKKQKLNSILLFSTSFLLLGGLLFYPLISHEAVTNDSTENYRPSMTTNNIQCKRVVIDPDSSRVPQPGVKGGATPECGPGYVAVGINNGQLNSYNAGTSTWLRDSDPDSWGASVSYVQYSFNYSKGTDSLNSVSMICVPREIVFKDGPCTD